MAVAATDLMSLQNKAARYLDELGISYEKLTEDELEVFEASFNRQFVLAFPQREIKDLFLRHKQEILMGAMVAKDQMSAAFEGQFPSSNKIGMCDIRAGFLGIGDDWEDAGSWTTGSPQNWIHSGTTLLGGTSGNPIRIGENAVHVVIAVGSKHPSPKLESVYFEIDGKPKPVITTHFATRLVPYGALPIKELDDAILLYKNKELLAKCFFSATFGSTVTDYPYLLGASFIKEPQLRIQDPYTLCGTSAARDAHKVVLTT